MKGLKLLNIIVFSFFTFVLFGQQNEVFMKKDLSEILGFVISKTDTSNFEDTDYKQWENYLSRAHPNVSTLHLYFNEAEKEFDIPSELLMAIAKVESNWTQIGPSIDKGWGIMHLVDNSYSNTLADAAELLNLNPQILKDNAQQNIRGMAALIAFQRKEKQEELQKLEDWFDILKPVTGLVSEELRELQVYEYYRVLAQGSISKTLWDEEIILEGQNLDISKYLNIENPYIFPKQASKAKDYPPAIPAFTSCNYTEGRNHEIDAWVNHWIGTGTYAGAISWFQNCDAEVSAHFVIRSSDGEISQVVDVVNTAWHCGASGYPFNNSRSIGVEHEATLANPDQWNSMPMLEASATMASYFCDEYEIPKILSLPGIRAHDQMPGTNTMCPGNLPWGLWMSLLDENFSEVDLVIMDMWTNPSNPEQGEKVELFVEIGNVGNVAADTVILDYRIENETIHWDTIIILEANSTHQLSFPHYQFTSFGLIDYCVYITPHTQEISILNNSYCIDINVNQAFYTSELTEQNQMNIFPNPCLNRLNFETNNIEIKQIEIYNMLGILVYQHSSIKDDFVDVSHLQNGFYVIKFLGSKGNYKSMKFQKE